MEHNLSPKHMSLCQLINEGKTSAEAGRIIGYTNSYVCRLLKEPDVKAYLDSIIDTKHERALIDATGLLVNLDNMFNADFGDIINKETNSFKKIHDMPEVWRQMIVGVKYSKKTGDIIELKFMDRLKILEMIGDHRGVQAFAKTHIHATVDYEKLTKRIDAGRQRLNELNAQNSYSETPIGGQPPKSRGGIEELSEESSEKSSGEVIDVEVVK